MRSPARLLTAVLVVTAMGALPSALAGQDTWFSASGGMFLDPGSVRDFETGTRWDFGTSFIATAGVHRALGQGLMAGLELGYSPARHEVRTLETGAIQDEGRAHVVTAMLTGRLGAGRASGFGTYLAGGLGTMVYGIPHLDGWDPDFALRGGGGVEYAPSREVGLYLEWTQWWVFHQSEGVQDNTVRHSTLDLGVRLRR